MEAKQESNYTIILLTIVILFIWTKKSSKEGKCEFLTYDGTLAVPDAASVFVMKTKHIDKILSFDSDFDKADGIVRIQN